MWQYYVDILIFLVVDTAAISLDMDRTWVSMGETRFFTWGFRIMGKLTLTVISLFVLFTANNATAEDFPPPPPPVSTTFIFDCSDIGWLRTTWVDYWGKSRYKDVYVGKTCEAQRGKLMQYRTTIAKVSYFAICSNYQWQDRFVVDQYGNFKEWTDRYYSKMEQCLKEAETILKN